MLKPYRTLPSFSRLRILQKEPSLRVETWEDLLTIGTKVCDEVLHLILLMLVHCKCMYWILVLAAAEAAEGDPTEGVAALADEVECGGRPHLVQTATRRRATTRHHARYAPEAESRGGGRGRTRDDLPPQGRAHAHAPRHAQGQRTLQEEPVQPTQQARQVRSASTCVMTS